MAADDEDKIGSLGFAREALSLITNQPAETMPIGERIYLVQALELSREPERALYFAKQACFDGIRHPLIAHYCEDAWKGLTRDPD